MRDVLEDRDGTLWVGTDGGLYEWRPTDQGFAAYLHDATDRSSLSDNRVTSLFQDRGGVLWVGTYNGLNSWNYLSDAFTYYQENGSAIRLSSSIVTAVEESRNGEVWVGTYGGGLNRVNLATASARFYRAADSGLPSDRVMALHVDPDGAVWIGMRGAAGARPGPVPRGLQGPVP